MAVLQNCSNWNYRGGRARSERSAAGKLAMPLTGPFGCSHLLVPGSSVIILCNVRTFVQTSTHLDYFLPVHTPTPCPGHQADFFVREKHARVAATLLTAPLNQLPRPNVCGDIGGGESHHSFAPGHVCENPANLAADCADDSKSTKDRHRSRGDARSMGPSALPGSSVVNNRSLD